jgi:hypothetical protein
MDSPFPATFPPPFAPFPPPPLPSPPPPLPPSAAGFGDGPLVECRALLLAAAADARHAGGGRAGGLLTLRARTAGGAVGWVGVGGLGGQVAHIGVGILGKEGQQAVLASDYPAPLRLPRAPAPHTRPLELRPHQHNGAAGGW